MTSTNSRSNRDFNRTIKEILKTRYFLGTKDDTKFDLKKELLYANKLYNEPIFSAIGLSPLTAFNTTDDNIFIKIKERTIKSKKYMYKKSLLLPENSLRYYAKIYVVSNKLLLPIFGGKGRYILSINTIKILLQKNI